MDETLYRERRFRLSGLAAVARHLENEFKLSASHVFGRLRYASSKGREHVFQTVCAELQLPSTLIPTLVEVYRGHAPRLKLPAESQRILTALRPTWRLGVLTNGLPAVQRRKVHALGLEPLVDAVVYACEHGTGEGKPDPASFLEILARLGAAAARTVFVGDDPWCDVAGARNIGMRTIRIRRGSHLRAPVTPANDADIVVPSLTPVPEAAALLLTSPEAHVA
jgi:putative hydrolase of the HAD superfamily